MEARPGPSGTQTTNGKSYSMFHILPLFSFRVKSKDALILCENLVNHIKMVLYYIKCAHHPLVIDRILYRLVKEDDLKRLLRVNSTRNAIMEPLREASKVCVCTAVEAFSLMNRITNESKPVDVEDHTASLTRSMQITTKTQIKLAYHLGRLYTSRHPILWEIVKDSFKKFAVEHHSAKGIDLESLVFSDYEHISAVEAVSILPMLNIETGTDDELIHFVECLKVALACVMPSQLEYFYDLIKCQKFPMILDDLDIHTYSMESILTMANELTIKAKTPGFFKRFNVEILSPESSCVREKLPIIEILDLVKGFESNGPFLQVLHMIFVMSRMVQEQDIDFLYTILMHRLISRNCDYEEYYSNDMGTFKNVCLKLILQAECKNIRGIPIDELGRWIDEMPEANGLAEKLKIKYPAILCVEMIGTMSKDHSIQSQAGRAMSSGLNFVYGDELALFNHMVEKNIKRKINAE